MPTLPPELLAQFGKNVKEARQRIGLSQEALAELHRTHVSAVERGQSNMTLVSMAKLARALGVNVDQLTNGLK